MSSPEHTCDHCGRSSPDGLTRWWAEEVVRPARHYRPPPDHISYSEPLAPPAPTLRVTYVMRAYDLCAPCHAAARQDAEQRLAGQRRGMAAVAILGLIAFGWVMLTALLHSDVLGRPLGQAKAWIYATPAPTPYKDPMRGVPSAP